MSDLVARVQDPARFTGDVGHPTPVRYEVRYDTHKVWTCTCGLRPRHRSMPPVCDHLHALWEGRIWEGHIPEDVGVLTKPHFLVELTPLGDELLRHRWAATTLQNTV